jgi:hypothetical protein
MRSAIFWLAMVAGTAVLPPAYAVDPAKLLNEPVSLGREIDYASLADVLGLFADKYEAPIKLDDAAFKKVTKASLGDIAIRMPKFEGVPLKFALEVAAHQVGETVRAEKDQIIIVPGQRDPASILGRPNDKLKAKLREKIDFPKNGVKGKFGDIIEYFSDKSGVTVITADWLFPPTEPVKRGAVPTGNPTAMSIRHQRPTSPLANLPCRLNAGTQSLQVWMDQAAKQVGCTVDPCRDVILITPLPKRGP